ncbi:MAG: hypothetical protein LLG42_02575 [Chloroflexi bacterium]|nr:hypothetical protein [Chloroflexota bacterium]
MRFLAFFRLQLHMLIMRWRWLLPLPVMVFIGYLLTNALKGQLLPEFLTQPSQAAAVNSWDALFIGFGNAYYMVFVIANLFLILVCDSLPESGFGQLALFRLGSRKIWWASKSLAMLMAAFIYTLGCVAVVFGVASLGLPVSFDWSPFGDYSSNILLPNSFQQQTTPLGAALVLLGMDVLGLWALGTLMQVIALLTRRYTYGYLAALLVLVGSMGLSGSLINVPDVLKLLPAIRNLIMTFYPYPFREVPIFWSFIYWGIWLAILIFAGWIISRRQNYLAQRH